MLITGGNEDSGTKRFDGSGNEIGPYTSARAAEGEDEQPPTS